MGVDILRNEISVLARLSDCANLLHARPTMYVSKGQNTFQCVRRSNIRLKNCLEVNENAEVVFNHLFSHNFENVNVKRIMLTECKGPSGAVVCELFVGRLNFELYRANVPCKKLRV
jgi:hypothetical protein